MNHDGIALEIIFSAAAAAFGVSYARVVGSVERGGGTADARLLAYWLARRMTTCSYPQIGAACGRHHTAVMSGERSATLRRQLDPDFELISNTVLSTLMTLERVGLVQQARAADAEVRCRRVLANPQREAVRLSVHEIVALALAVAANTSPATEEEAEHGQD